jgi:hypothetical protein
MPERITTISIIQALPFEKVEKRFNIKERLLNSWSDGWNNEFTPDDKFEMEQIIWNTFGSISKLKTEEYLILAASQRGISKENLPADVKSEVYGRSNQEMYADEWPDAPLNIVADTARKLTPYILKRFEIPGVNSPALEPKLEMSKASINRQDVARREAMEAQQNQQTPQPQTKKHWWQR